ncbi:SDR family oxidoreductase [Nodularia harveyana UHCC-0300]|uniref:SDR family oxidoreductase n=1 Tax=Nodularia harveyana UHCC-0300 TaxID=2974287 RepID=A0ABU5U984_9CYAN|nr:SDR family oxidoreductase [Nodularia harveyana]MEA5580069.1 SDR family oxidoreductase [Nodularia harveyana UHCC-0300]
MTVQKKIAIVTGSNRGLGSAISRKLSQIGIQVVLTSRNKTDGLATKEQLLSEGLDVDYHQLDVTNDSSVQDFTDWLRETYGKLDILVNNAGINPTTKPEESSLLTVQLDTMRSTFDTNILALLRISQALIPLMKVHNYGRIVNISTEMASLNSISGDYYPLAPSYRLSKLGVNGLTVLLGKELLGSNILVNAYSPGWMKTDMGGENAPFTAEEGAETAVYLATLPDGGAQGQFFAEMRKFGGPIQLQW